VGDILEGDWRSAGINIGLALLPFVPGTLDNAWDIARHSDNIDELLDAARFSDDALENIIKPLFDPRSTKPSLEPSLEAVPSGKRSKVPGGKASRDDKLDFALENQNADGLTKTYGYHVIQNPDDAGIDKLAIGFEGSPLNTPDYIIEGRAFEHKAPRSSKDEWGIADGMILKANEDNGVNRVVVDMSRNDTPIEEINKTLNSEWYSENPRREILEVIYMRDQKIIGIWLPPE